MHNKAKANSLQKANKVCLAEMRIFMRYKMNPVYRRESKLRVGSVKFAMTVLLYNLFLVGIALFGFEMVFNVRWNNYVDYSGAPLVYLVLISIETTMVVFMVPAYTAGSIAGEREKQTLDILLTTVMTPGQIIIGKLMSSISMVLLLVLSSLPVLSLVFTVGGVGLADLFQFVAVEFIIAIFIGSIGVLASAMFQKTVRATIFSFGIVLLLCVGTIAVVVVIYLLQQMYYWNVLQSDGEMPNMAWCTLVLLFNPIVTMGDMIMQQYGHARQFRSAISDMGGLPDFVVNNWLYLSILVQMICSAGLLWLAERVLDPLHKHGRRKRIWRVRRYRKMDID